MAEVVIRSNTRNPCQVSLRREHEGIQGKTLFLRPRERRTGPTTLLEEPDLMGYGRSGVLTISVDRDEEKKRSFARLSRKKKAEKSAMKAEEDGDER